MSAPERLSIVHVTTFYPPETFGGDGVHVQRLARAQTARGHRVAVIHAPAAFHALAPDDPQPVSDIPDDAAGIVRHRISAGASLEPYLVHQLGRPVMARRQLARWLADPGGGRPDVIHYHNVSLAGGVGVLSMGDAVKLYTCHEYWLTCPTHMLFRFDREVCTRRTCLRCTLRAGRPPQLWRRTGARDRHLAALDRMIFPSETTRRVYREQGIHNPGVVLPHFLPSSWLENAASLGARRPDSPDYFLYVGRLDAVKGVERLLEAFATRSGGPTLRVAGDGPLAPTLRSRFGDHPAIRLLGQQSPAALGELYRDALALILPSAGYEIFGQVVVEAFAHRTPAVVTEVGGASELVRDPRAGVVYRTDTELHAALDRLAVDDSWRERLGNAGRERVQTDLGEDVYMERYEELVRECRAS